MPDRGSARTLFRAQNEISVGVAGARSGAARTIGRAHARAVDRRSGDARRRPISYVDAVIAIAGTEGEIAKLDQEVLGAEGRLIGRVTELLRARSAQQGRVLSHDFARTLAEAKWQSIMLGSSGVLIAIFAAIFVVRRTVRPLAEIAQSIRALAAGNKDASIPDTDVQNEIGDIARAAEVFRRTLSEADSAREAAVRALERAAARGRELSQAVRSLD